MGFFFHTELYLGVRLKMLSAYMLCGTEIQNNLRCRQVCIKLEFQLRSSVTYGTLSYSFIWWP